VCAHSGGAPLAHEFDVRSIPSLSEAEAARRLEAEGPNELPSARKRNIFAIAYEVIREPMFLLLVVGGILYLILGDVEEALMLLGFVFVVIGITLYQERKTQRALEALRDLSSPRAMVIRDGAERRIAGREVVRGDALVVREGDRVPADAVLAFASNLLVDESLLTGESVPVRKVAADGAAEIGRPGGDDQPCIYSSTLVVQGYGAAVVSGTGVHTEVGRIGKSLMSVEQEPTLLQKETRRLVQSLAIMGLSLCLFVIVVYGLTRGDWLRGSLAGITLAMAMLPEEFPVVLTIFLALGAWRISKSHVLARQVPVVEMLGSASVLCVDKTGTLTLNRMSVEKLFAQGEHCDLRDRIACLPEKFHELVEFSILASQRDPFDPMEKAIKDLGDTYLAETEHLHQDWVLTFGYPLSKNLMAMSQVWKSPDGRDYVIAAKGAPEAIADLCHFGDAEMGELVGHIHGLAAEGLRILGVARASFQEQPLPGEQHDFRFEFLGLVGLADPVRPTVAESVRECYSAGIRVVMITGDYMGTAQNIARQIGLRSNGEGISGPELDAMSDQDLQERIGKINIFARVVPEQKLRLVNALKANGEIVAMTGDGVNDAPALKSAHIGIAMGGRGTDVARESSALVLLDDDFSSIVRAVRMGRRIFGNIRKAMAYILAIHVPIAGLSLIPVLLKWPLILLPVHIVFLELIIDPACSVVFEAEREEADVMRRPPRDTRKPLFGRRTVGLSLLQGASILVIVLAVFLVARRLEHDPEKVEYYSRTMVFVTLVVANLSLILTNLSWSRTIAATLRMANNALWWVAGGAVAVLGMVLYVPPLRSLFRFEELHFGDLLICLAAGVGSIMWFEVLKLFRRDFSELPRRQDPGRPHDKPSPRFD
jgi:Ca2+-transporting ATPase